MSGSLNWRNRYYDAITSSKTAWKNLNRTNPTLEIRAISSPSKAETFRSLNEAWITVLFELEEQDRLTLGDPFGTILAQGGQVFVAVEDDEIVGTAALIRHAPGVYQLAKMTVASSARERGVGRRMLRAVLDEAKLLGAHRLFLGSSTKLEKAVRLFRVHGLSARTEIRYSGT